MYPKSETWKVEKLHSYCHIFIKAERRAGLTGLAGCHTQSSDFYKQKMNSLRIGDKKNQLTVLLYHRGLFWEDGV